MSLFGFTWPPDPFEEGETHDSLAALAAWEFENGDVLRAEELTQRSLEKLGERFD